MSSIETPRGSVAPGIREALRESIGGDSIIWDEPSRSRNRLSDKVRLAWSLPPCQARTGSGWGRSAVFLLTVDLLELGDAVLAADRADGPRAGAHHDRLGGGVVGEEADALDHRAVGDPGGGEEDVVAFDEVVDRQDAVEVVAGLEGGLALLV